MPGLSRGLIECVQPYRLLGLRQRYLFNKRNKLRLRYLAMSSACVFSLAGFTVSHALQPFSLSSIETASGEVDFASLELEALQMDETVNEFQSEPLVRRRFANAISETLQSHISDGMRRATHAIQKAPQPETVAVKIKSGGTIAGALEEAGVNAQDAYQAIQTLSEHYNPRHIKAGQEVALQFRPDENGTYGFHKLSMKIDPVREVSVLKEGGTFTADFVEKELKRNTHARQARIQTSLYGSAAQAGIPSQVIAEVIRVYSWDIDFQRDIRQGDAIEIMYDTYETEDGSFAKYGDVVYANLSVGGKSVPIYRFEMEDGRVDYFQPDGRSIRKTLMKTPIDGARISSGFGMRKHPVLGYNKMHKGMDFAAPTGTPIYAAGDGVVDFAGRKGAYGNYVRLRHNSTLKTAYAHMHRLAKGIKQGQRVDQGDIIGYVGTTGRSTGPHLHYEVLVNSVQVNPKSVDLPTGEELRGRDLEKFKAQLASLKQQYVSLIDGTRLASRAE